MSKCKICDGERVLFYHGEVCMCADCSDDMKLSNYIVAIRASNKQLEQQLKETQDRLKNAESVIRFYADVNNWSYQQIIDDVNEVNGSLESGAKAREYFKKYEGSE